MYYLCEKYYQPITDSTIQLIVSVGYLGYLCWTYSLLERNSFVCRGLTVGSL